VLVRVWQKNERIFRCVVRTILPDLTSVEDILQEAFSRVLQAETRFENERDAFNFLRKTVVTTSIDHYRYRRRQKRLLESGSASSDFVSDNSASPLDRLLYLEETKRRKSRLEQVRQVLQRLPREQQEAIQIIFGKNGKKIRDVCEEAGIPYSTVRSRMLRGVDEIRRQLRRKGHLRQSERSVDESM